MNKYAKRLFATNFVFLAISVLYGLDVIPYFAFFVAFYFANSWNSIAAHDAMHISLRKEQITSAPYYIFNLLRHPIVYPFQESWYLTFEKHLKHHAAYDRGDTKGGSLESNPHKICEEGHPLKSFLKSLFANEVYFFYNLKRFTYLEVINALVSLPMAAGLIYFFGFEKYLAIMLTQRFFIGLGLWYFSYLNHNEAFIRLMEKCKRSVFPRNILSRNPVLLNFIYHIDHHHQWSSVTDDYIDLFQPKYDPKTAGDEKTTVSNV